jgi:hypothetical protein
MSMLVTDASRWRDGTGGMPVIVNSAMLVTGQQSAGWRVNGVAGRTLGPVRRLASAVDPAQIVSEGEADVAVLTAVHPQPAVFLREELKPLFPS